MAEIMNAFENEELLNIVTVGHVDHGKSTVIGRLLADAGALPKGKLEAIRENCRRNSKPFEYAFLLDALHNEQDQGITIDTARCFFKSEKRRYIIIDAPGHIEFLKNMVTGASRAEAAASSAAASSAAASQAASEPEEEKPLDGKAITGGSWAAVDVSTLADDAAIRAAAQQLKAQGADYGLVTLKTPDGSICYASQVPAAAQSIADTTVDPARIAAIFREEGVIPVAQLAAFKDPISSRTDRSMAIHYGDGLWLDAQKDGNAWLNPYSAAAVEYVGDLVAEVQGMGFEQVVLTNVQFPKLSRKQDYGETSGVSRADQLKADIAALQSRFAGSMTLWFSYTLDQCNTNSVSLDVPAVTLGMDNLLVTADKAMDADSRTALQQSAAGQGVQHLVLHSADIFQ